MRIEPNCREKDLQSLQDRFSSAEKEFQRAIESQSELCGRPSIARDVFKTRRGGKKLGIEARQYPLGS